MRNYEIKLVDSSRKIADILTDDIGNDPVRLSEMLELSLRDVYPLSMRAARIVSLTAEKYPALVAPFMPGIINQLKVVKVEGVRGSFMKMISETDVEFSEDQLGILADMAFTSLNNSREAIAIRYYSLDILLKIIKIYPDLANELKEILNGMTESDTPALKSKTQQVLKQLRNT